MRIEKGTSKEVFTVIVRNKIYAAVKAYSEAKKEAYEKEDYCYDDPMVYSQFVKYMHSAASLNNEGNLREFNESKLWDDIKGHVNMDYLYEHYLNNPYFADNFVVIFEKWHLPHWLERDMYMAYWAR